MKKLIGENNKVNYGCIDEAIHWNYQDFELRDFFGREIKGFRKKRVYHQFNYIGITAGEYIIGFAAVDLGIIKNVFAFLYRKPGGVIFESNAKFLGSSPKMLFSRNPDEYAIDVYSRKIRLKSEKSHGKNLLTLDANFGERLEIHGTFSYSIEKNHPLRVLNPSTPGRFTFTEKCAPLRADSMEIYFDGKPLDFHGKEVTAIYDWSGGYLRRETNWYWTAFGGILPGGQTIGINLAAFVNETYYSENAVWIDGKRTRIPRVIFDFDEKDPHRPWRIFDEEGIVELIFHPEDERGNRINSGPLLKMVFSQYIGDFQGCIHPPGGKKTAFRGIQGFCEIQRAIW